LRRSSRNSLLLLFLLCLSFSCLAEEVQFKAGPDQIFGSLEIPQSLGTQQRFPAILLISGSGPTDRDGNSALLKGKIDSHRHLAQLLTNHGYVTLRYDKLFSGKTGVASHASDRDSIGMSTYVDGAQAAYQYLAQRSEVDPDRLLILGHSEGALIALIQAKEKQPAGLRGLVLAMPMSEPYLKTMYDQIASQFEAAVNAGRCPQADADRELAALAQVIKELITTGTAPSRNLLDKSLQAVFPPASDTFLSSSGRYDPAMLANELKLPVLVFSGTKDIQITRPMVQHLMTGLESNTQANWTELTDVNHVLKVVPGKPKGVADYVDPKLPFSSELDQRLLAWLKVHL
jgi:uncharacterized protein